MAAREAYDEYFKDGFVTPQVASVPDASIEEELKAIIDVFKGGVACAGVEENAAAHHADHGFLLGNG